MVQNLDQRDSGMFLGLTILQSFSPFKEFRMSVVDTTTVRNKLKQNQYTFSMPELILAVSSSTRNEKVIFKSNSDSIHSSP